MRPLERGTDWEDFMVSASPTGLGLFCRNPIGPGTVIGMIDLQEPRHVLQWINHSCTPNALLYDDLELVARQFIPAGAEITLDYVTTVDVCRGFACRCGAANCSGWIDSAKLQLRPRRGRRAAYLLIDTGLARLKNRERLQKGPLPC